MKSMSDKAFDIKNKFDMKNKLFEKAFNTQVLTLSAVNQKRIPRLKKSVEMFESQGYDLSKMTRSEAKELSSIICDGLSYTSAVSYCAVLNRFIKDVEDQTGKQFEKVYATRSAVSCPTYASEDQFLDEVENQIEAFTSEMQRDRNLNDEFTQEYRNGLNYIAVYLILRFYGITADECVNIKMEDVSEENQIIILNRNGRPVLKKFSDRAWKHILDLKNQTYVVHFWAHIIRNPLPNTGYLFRNNRAKNKADYNEKKPISKVLLSSAQYRLTKGSNIKKNLSLSGAFISFPKRISDANDLLDYVHDYIGDEPISDASIKKNWLLFLDYENEMIKQAEMKKAAQTKKKPGRKRAGNAIATTN